MIGNDVIDLERAAIESNWRRRGFLQKIFSKEERQFIEDAVNPDVAVWSLWSRKEAAYKIWNRNSRISSFNPGSFSCDFGSDIGIVTVSDAVIYTKTEIVGTELHTVGVNNIVDLDRIVISLQPLQSVKISGLPYMKISAGYIPCSISHHGQYYRLVYIN